MPNDVPPPGLQQAMAAAGHPPPGIAVPRGTAARPGISLAGVESKAAGRRPPPVKAATPGAVGAPPPKRAAVDAKSVPLVAPAHVQNPLEDMAAAMAEHLRASTAMMRRNTTGVGSSGMNGWIAGEDNMDGENEEVWSRMTNARGSVGMEQWKDFIAKHPEKVSQMVRKNLTRKLADSPEGLTGTDPRIHSMTEYFTQEGGFDKARALPYATWVICTAFNQMGRGEWHSSEATLALGLCAIDQSLVDKGRWNTAWLFAHLPEPPWSKVSTCRTENVLRPFTPLLPAPWAAIASAYAKEMAALGELKKKAIPTTTKTDEKA